MGKIPLLAASNGQSLPFLERNEIGCSMEREVLSWNMCLTLIVKALGKKSTIGIYPCNPSIHSCIHFVIHSLM